MRMRALLIVPTMHQSSIVLSILQRLTVRFLQGSGPQLATEYLQCNRVQVCR